MNEQVQKKRLDRYQAMGSKVIPMEHLLRLIEDSGGVKKFAARIGYKHPYVSDIKHRKLTPSFKFLRRVQAEFGVILDPLSFDRDEEPEPLRATLPEASSEEAEG